MLGSTSAKMYLCEGAIFLTDSVLLESSVSTRTVLIPAEKASFFYTSNVLISESTGFFSAFIFSLTSSVRGTNVKVWGHAT